MKKMLFINNEKRQLMFILLSFGFFSLSRGLWYNYQNLWMQENGFTTTTISVVTGFASLLSVSVIFLFSNLIRRDRLKGFITGLMFVKFVLMLVLLILNGSGYHVLIKFLIMVDLVVDTSVVTSIYPVISLVRKNDFIYSLKGIISSSFYDLGVLCSGIFLGKVMLGFSISYNILLFMAIMMLIIGFWLLLVVSISVEKEVVVNKREVFFHDFLMYLKRDCISKWYFLYVFLGNVAFYSIYGLRMLMLTEVVMLSPNQATNSLLIVGMIADFVAFLILKYFTSKYYFVNIVIKFGGRLLFCLLAFFTNHTLLFMLSLFYTMLFSEAYNHVTDAPYINRVLEDFQFSFVNLKGMISYLAQAIGIWICGFSFLFGVRYMFGLVAVIVFCQIMVIIKLQRMRLSKTRELVNFLVNIKKMC